MTPDWVSAVRLLGSFVEGDITEDELVGQLVATGITETDLGLQEPPGSYPPRILSFYQRFRRKRLAVESERTIDIRSSC
jgi:hypothetical protein